MLMSHMADGRLFHTVHLQNVKLGCLRTEYKNKTKKPQHWATNHQDNDPSKEIKF